MARCLSGPIACFTSWPLCRGVQQVSFFSSVKQLRDKRCSLFSCSSQQGGVPEEIREDPKFVSINDDDPCYGPAAVLLVGFEREEISMVRKFLKDIDGDFVKLILCTQDMLNDTVWNCVNTTQPSDMSKIEMATGVPRVCFLSGMSGEEIMTYIHSFPEIGLKPCVFAALVPGNAESQLLQVLEEVMGDHQRLNE